MLFTFAREAAGASSARYSLRPLFHRAISIGKPRTDHAARMRSCGSKLSSSGLTGRSSIPETPAIESRSRGVLDAPLSRSMTSEESVAWGRIRAVTTIHRQPHPGMVGTLPPSLFELRRTGRSTADALPTALIPSAGQCRTQPVNARQFRGTVQPADGGCCPKVQLASLA